ncbi:MAG: hypothetical protein HY849_00365 [Nitrosomonadales bacterium]|nr:hypothetical protein [Nitrosomonadales bacterium]
MNDFDQLMRIFEASQEAHTALTVAEASRHAMLNCLYDALKSKDAVLVKRLMMKMVDEDARVQFSRQHWIDLSQQFQSANEQRRSEVAA